MAIFQISFTLPEFYWKTPMADGQHKMDSIVLAPLDDATKNG
jgi:hypothetical protein